MLLPCSQERQTIRQYHYNAWPDHGKPDSPDPILRMIEMMNDYRKQPEVPIVVHCRWVGVALQGGCGLGSDAVLFCICMYVCMYVCM